MIIEGKNPVKEALNSSANITKVYIQNNHHDTKEIIALAKKRNIRIDFVEKRELDKLSDTGKHQGLIAISESHTYYTVDDILNNAKSKNEPLFMLILDGIEDPHNLGSIIRVAECAGVHGIVIPSRRAVSVNDTVVKVSAGASSHVMVAKVTNINDTIRELKDKFINIFALDMAGTTIYDSHLEADTALVVGNEGFGVKALTKKLCDGVLSLPQYGKVNSLNASVATGIAVYEVIRQRNFKK